MTQHYWRITARAGGILRLKTVMGDVETIIIVPSFFIRARNQQEAEELSREIIDPLKITEVNISAQKITGKKTMERLRQARTDEEEEQDEVS